MPSLSLHQTRSHIEKLGDLENELTRICRVAEVMAKEAGKDMSSAADRLKEACDSVREHIKYVSEAKNRLLEFDGFLHAQGHAIREALARPHMSTYLGEVGDRLGAAVGKHVQAIGDEAEAVLRKTAEAIRSLRDAELSKEGEASIKESVKALEKSCAAAEKAVSKGLKQKPSKAPEPEDAEEVLVVEKSATGYDLTAALPPEFLENAQKKKDEASKKKDEEKSSEKDKRKEAAHGYRLRA